MATSTLPIPTRVTAGLLSLGLALAMPVAPLEAQAAERDTAGTSVEWWHAALAAGGVVTLMVVDEPIARFMQDARSGTTDDLASVVEEMGNYPFYLSVAGGTLALGLVSGDADISRAGARVTAALAMTGGLTLLGKFGTGRERPSQGLDSDNFDPFTGGRESLPSGHTSMAFALATSLADEIRRPWATVGLYTGAGLVGWARLNDNQHWLSDVVAGAVLGTFCAKLVNGRWRVFNVRPPGVAASREGVLVTWHLAF